MLRNKNKALLKINGKKYQRQKVSTAKSIKGKKLSALIRNYVSF